MAIQDGHRVTASVARGIGLNAGMLGRIPLRLPQGDLALLSMLMMAYVLLVIIRSPDFLSLASLFDLVQSGAAYIILACGVLVVMVSGGIDVSFLANAIFSAYVATTACNSLGIDSLALALTVAIGCGTLIGVVNGLVIYLFSLPTLITTLAMQGVLQGILMVFLRARPITAAHMPHTLRALGTDVLFVIPSAGEFLGLSVFAAPLLAVLILTWYLLNRTTIGRATYAVGSNLIAARRCGVSILGVDMFVYAYAGALAGLAGLLMVSDVRLVDPVSLVGNELFVLAAVVIGGAKLTGGSGSVLGVLLGSTLITLLSNTLVTIGLSSSWNRFFVGAALVLIASVSHYRAKVAGLRKLNFGNI